jgi:hypothetical protein
MTVFRTADDKAAKNPK